MAQSVQLLGYGPDGPGFEFRKEQKTCDICECFGFFCEEFIYDQCRELIFLVAVTVLLRAFVFRGIQKWGSC
jgi:hypothetical protein